MALKNGGKTLLYKWGQTLDEVTVQLNVEGLRAKELSVSFSRCRITVTVKATGHKLLAGELQQPIICEDSSWMMEDGVMILQLAKDNKRPENERERVDELNNKLSTMTEHNDIPRISAAGNG